MKKAVAASFSALASLADGAVRLRLRGGAIDPILCCATLAVMGYGLVALHSIIEGDQSLFRAQLMRLGLGALAMLIASQVQPGFYRRWTPLGYLLGLALLVAVPLIGVQVKGAQRWLEVPGLLRFQPSELMKLAVPMMAAWYLHNRRQPPSIKDLVAVLAIIGLPVGLIVMQPDLGTGILVAVAGLAVLLLAGLQWRWMAGALLAALVLAPLMWSGMRDYQRRRIVTLFDPESDPLGAGWNIIQSTTAIGSGGLFGKGLGQGTQGYLQFLPESHTDFIVAVVGEELGFVGMLTLLALYMLIVGRGLHIATQAGTRFGSLLAGSLSLMFFVSLFVNVAMVAGMLPVVGIPLPLVSYGGTSAITFLAGFGIIMAIRGQRAW